MAYQPGDTIVAISTPLGRGAISLIRLSGKLAEELVRNRFCTSAAWVDRVARTGSFLDPDGQLLDRVVVTFFRGPASYTGEDVAEISGHGSPLVTQQILGSLLRGGARLAQPGEFTLRAFLHGKMDLAQAEAGRDLIHSQTSFQAQLSRQQLEGVLSRQLEPLKREWIRIMSHMETSLEFVEEDVDAETRQGLLQCLGRLDESLGKLESGFRLGRLVQAGLVVAITGKPNVGKSSVFNALLEYERAIVTSLPGTTRDAVAETIDLRGVPTRMVDTAGIRAPENAVERLGVKKSLDSLQEADVVLWVMDGSDEFDPEDRKIWELVREQSTVLAINKEDLPRRIALPAEVEAGCVDRVTMSALQGTHLEELKVALWKAAVPGEGREAERVLITNIRHKRCLEAARAQLRRGMVSFGKGLSEEFPLYDLKKGLEALGEITGEVGVEDLLEEIFSTFCIGK